MRRSLLVLIWFAAAAAVSDAQDANAVRTLEAALAALGGAEKIRSFKSIYFSARGFEDSSVNAQPYRPGKEARSSHEEKLAVFLDGRRLAYELKTERGDSTTRHRRFFFPDTRRLVLDFGTKSAFASNIQYPSADRNQDARRIPHAFLLEVLANSSTLREARSVDVFSGGEFDVFSVTLPGARVPVSLHFDRNTKLLAKYEFTADYPGLGPSLFEYMFNDWAPHAQLVRFPTKHEIRINGKTFRGLKIEKAAADSPEADAMLTIPADLAGLVMPAGTVKEVAKGVYFVYGVQGFQPMFIEFANFIMAIEAPAGAPVLEDTPVETIGNMNAATEEFIAKIKQTIPNKPIKYVVVTHSHADHFGGLRAFLPDKPTVITTPGNKAYIEKFVPELTVEAVEKRRSIKDASMHLDLIDVGRNPHTEENLIVYLPQSKYLFQGDLFYFNNEATFPALDRMTVMPFFAKWLKANKLEPERIYGFHSTMFGTMAHIEKILKLSADKTR
ncbi:MAG TPA: MBL fold metallo-hydrolase [Pyrinomonadaceae bacterium]|nr:MBL fold metallo-hydrolase [Pyrinomonadaceae bacterium]